MPFTAASLVRSTAALLLAGLVALIAIVAVSLWLVNRTEDQLGEIVQARDLRSVLADLRATLQQLESVQRGYLLSGQESYLGSYDAARHEVTRLGNDLAGLAAAFPEIAPSATALEDLVARKVAELEETVALARDGRKQEALAVFGTDRGEALMNETRAMLDVMVERAEARLTARLEEQRESVALLRLVTSGGAVVILIVVGGAIWSVWRYTNELSNARETLQSLYAGLEERVRERTEELARANEEVQRFAYVVTHDLRAPLVNIMGFTSELEASLAPVQALVIKAEESGLGAVATEARSVAMEELPEAIGFIRSSTRKMDGLINAILKLSREGRRPLRPERVDLEQLARAAADSVQHQVSEAGGAVEIDIRAPALISDRMSLEQVFGNLLDNAVKYRRPNVPLQVDIRARPAAANRIEIEFEDNGRGIAEQDRERVFELFRRSGTQDQPGEGIGLAHVRSAVRMLGGDITLTSRLGHGTTFRIILPRDLQAAIGSKAS